MDKDRERVTIKALLYWLRHHPTHIGLSLQKEGWADLEALVRNSQRKHKVTLEEVQEIVDNDDKNRFTIVEVNNRKMIKANEGHTVKNI